MIPSSVLPRSTATAWIKRSYRPHRHGAAQAWPRAVRDGSLYGLIVALSRCWVRNYRSLVDVTLDPAQLTVIVGENGTGKTNLYRALSLLSRGAGGGLARSLLEEGGMPSVLYAGRRK